MAAYYNYRMNKFGRHPCFRLTKQGCLFPLENIMLMIESSLLNRRIHKNHPFEVITTLHKHDKVIVVDRAEYSTSGGGLPKLKLILKIKIGGNFL